VYGSAPPYRSFALSVSHGHALHVQESGRPDGVPALLLHGGPGSGLSPLLQRFFDPSRYRVIGVDQRGAGRSIPAGDTAHNTTALLLDDLQRLRRQLGIARWLVVGGSWGATLALAHALHEPEAVAALLLRALFMPSRAAIDEFFGGCGFDWRRVAAAPRDEARTIALAWWRHEHARAGVEAREVDDLDALARRYAIQSHYLQHGCWLDQPPLLQRCGALPRVPTLLLHGDADRVCPLANARALQRAAPQVALRVVDGAGHDPAHPAMAAAMVEALDRYARERRFSAKALV
jgi:proline iminopeptidase